MTFVTTNPRLNYYNFAHRLIPSLIFTGLDDFCEGVTAATNDDYLNKIWEKLGQELDLTITAEEKIKCFTVKLGTLKRLHVIQMPQPKAPLECFWLGLVVDLAVPKIPTVKIKNQNPLYFTLELNGETTDPTKPRNYFCEWQQNGNHLNHSELNSNTRKTFETAIRNQIKAA